MIDAHCHLDFPRFDKDRDALLNSARAAGVRGFVVAGVSPDAWDAQAALEAAHPDIVSCFGIHPHTAARYDKAALAAALDQLAARARLAIGELGLDNSKYVPRGSLPTQEVAFRAQLALARDRNLPIVLHVLQAHGRALAILKADGVPAAGGMVHSYSGPPALVGDYEALGLYLSFSGSITRPTATRGPEAARRVRADRLLVETDCPDQRPTGVKGSRNLPEYLPLIVAAVATARYEAPAEVAERTAANARRLFGLPAS